MQTRVVQLEGRQAETNGKAMQPQPAGADEAEEPSSCCLQAAASKPAPAVEGLKFGS